MSEEKKTPSEGRLILELEELLDSLPDDAARQRVLEWAQNRWGSTKTGSEPVKTAPTVNPLMWDPLAIGLGTWSLPAQLGSKSQS